MTKVVGFLRYMAFYIYILYSDSSDIYYVGYTNDFERRLTEHNNSEFATFTSKHRPWKLKAVFSCGSNKSNAVRIERFIKKQKNRKLIRFGNQHSFLAQLVRASDC